MQKRSTINNDVSSWSVSLCAKTRQIAIGSNAHTVSLWDLDSNHLHVLGSHAHNVPAVAISENGERVASCSIDGTLKLWDTRTALCVASTQPCQEWFVL